MAETIYIKCYYKNMKKERKTVAEEAGLTREQVEENIRKLTEEVKLKVAKLEASQRVTQRTMDLTFDAPGQCRINHH